MSRMKNRLLSAAIFSAALFFINSCILNPETDTKPPPPVEVEWPELYEKEDVIETISLCYEHYNSVTPNDLEEHYTNILYQGEGYEYVFYYQEGDVEPGEDPLMTLEQDVQGSMYIWEKSTFLNLDLSGGTWGEVAYICPDCWITTREYTITTTIDHNGEILDLSGAGMTVEFIVRPHHDDPTKWAIFQVNDLPAQ